jgi:ribosome-associated protein
MKQPKELALRIAEVIDAKKGDDILVINVGHLTSIADYFVIASGRSALSVRALAEEVDEKLAAEGICFRRHEGMNEARWIVMDYASVIVHIFHTEERQYYNIERLWLDGSNQVSFKNPDQ